MLPRHKQILELLRSNQTETVNDLSDKLDVSPVTVRSDLNQLAAEGQVVRIRGGASLPAGRAGQELSFAARQKLNSEKKIKIGRLAAELVNPMESILLDASTTSIAVAKAIRLRGALRDITVIPTGIWTAAELLGCNLDVIIAGGHVRHSTGSITGLPADDFLKKFNFQKAFLGAWGVDLMQGFTDTALVEAELKRSIVERAQEIIVVADGSKFERVGLTSFAGIERVDRIVTDDSAPKEFIEKIRSAGVEVLVAD